MAFPLSGCSILVIEDEALIALDIADAFESAGARVVLGHSLQVALRLFEAENWSAAVLDHILGEEDSSPLCDRLTERGIPFVLYSGRDDIHGACGGGVQVGKPADTATLVRVIVDLVQGDVAADVLRQAQ